MTQQTRKHFGKLWKLGKEDCPGFEKYYNEFKIEIDAELFPEGE